MSRGHCYLLLTRRKLFPVVCPTTRGLKDFLFLFLFSCIERPQQLEPLTLALARPLTDGRSHT